MKDKLCISERRTRIIDFLVMRKHSTYLELAVEFNVSVNTIGRDIDYLSAIAPIYTKQGNNGGVYIRPDYRSYAHYLTNREEDCLCRLMNKSNNEDKLILCEIITKFAKTANR